MEKLELPGCPKCGGQLALAASIGPDGKRPAIRVLKCTRCTHLGWYFLEGGVLREWTEPIGADRSQREAGALM
jgi:hypothetical protein